MLLSHKTYNNLYRYLHFTHKNISQRSYNCVNCKLCSDFNVINYCKDWILCNEHRQREWNKLWNLPVLLDIRTFEKLTQQIRNEVQWTLWIQLDDLALLSHNCQQMQEKKVLPDIASQIGVNINKEKIMTVSETSAKPETLKMHWKRWSPLSVVQMQTSKQGTARQEQSFYNTRTSWAQKKYYSTQKSNSLAPLWTYCSTALWCRDIEDKKVSQLKARPQDRGLWRRSIDCPRLSNYC